MSEERDVGKDASSDAAAGAPPVVRRVYQTPSLVVFGSVRELTGSGSGGDADSNMPMVANSDAALKENVVRIGDHPAGFGIYLFDYKPEFRARCGHGRQFGVIANEVEQFVPEAVTLDRDGYRQVDYGMLGVSRQ